MEGGGGVGVGVGGGERRRLREKESKRRRQKFAPKLSNENTIKDDRSLCRCFKSKATERLSSKLSDRV